MKLELSGKRRVSAWPDRLVMPSLSNTKSSEPLKNDIFILKHKTSGPPRWISH